MGKEVKLNLLSAFRGDPCEEGGAGALPEPLETEETVP